MAIVTQERAAILGAAIAFDTCINSKESHIMKLFLGTVSKMTKVSLICSAQADGSFVTADPIPCPPGEFCFKNKDNVTVGDRNFSSGLTPC